MRRFVLVLLVLHAGVGFAASTPSRQLVRKRIAALATSQIENDAIEIRGIKSNGPGEAIVESTVTIAFQFNKTEAGDWAVDAIRLGDRDWVSMNELLAAIYQGKQPKIASSEPIRIQSPVTPLEKFHINKSDFEKERASMIELGLSSQVPDAIEIRRVIYSGATRVIAETTVTLGFLFKRDPKSKTWVIESGRLGDREWIGTSNLLATLTEGRRTETLAKMRKLAAGIEVYRARRGSLPTARDIVELTDQLHPEYMSELIREDGWGNEIQYAISGSTFHLRSSGPDGRFGTTDDLVVTSGAPSAP